MVRVRVVSISATAVTAALVVNGNQRQRQTLLQAGGTRGWSSSGQSRAARTDAVTLTQTGSRNGLWKLLFDSAPLNCG